MLAGCYSGKYEEEINPCDPDVPVVLNGDTIPEDIIWRDDEGCVTAIDLGGMGISDSNCLAGIELYSTLGQLYLYYNNLLSINLSPLSSCTELWFLALSNNNLTNINLTPLSSCTNLEWLSLWENQLTNIDLTSLCDMDSLEFLGLNDNPLDSASCAHVCDFIDEHPDCYVYTDCACGGKSERKDEQTKSE